MKKRLPSLILFFLLPAVSGGFAQARDPDSGAIFFISDCQEPLLLEKLSGRSYKNAEGRDSLFADIVRQHPRYLVMLGDLIGNGSSAANWRPVNSFLSALRKAGCQAHAIPGNHEYLMNPGKAMRNYIKTFGENEVKGYCIIIGASAVVLLNSNFSQLSKEEKLSQQNWYLSKMDFLDKDSVVKTVIVATHFPPYTNSTVVDPDKKVEQDFVPRFEQSPKARLFLSGHSHNLECFQGKNGKKYLAIGGGGGLAQPVYPEGKGHFIDKIPQEKKPLFFYILVTPKGENLSIEIRGFDNTFKIISFFLP